MVPEGCGSEHAQEVEALTAEIEVLREQLTHSQEEAVRASEQASAATAACRGADDPCNAEPSLTAMQLYSALPTRRPPQQPSSSNCVHRSPICTFRSTCCIGARRGNSPPRSVRHRVWREASGADALVSLRAVPARRPPARRHGASGVRPVRGGRDAGVHARLAGRRRELPGLDRVAGCAVPGRPDPRGRCRTRHVHRELRRLRRRHVGRAGSVRGRPARGPLRRRSTGLGAVRNRRRRRRQAPASARR